MICVFGGTLNLTQPNVDVEMLRCTDKALADYRSADNQRLTIDHYWSIPINTKNLFYCLI